MRRPGARARTRIWRRVPLILLAALAACQTTPGPGTVIHAVVVQVPLRREAIAAHQAVAETLEPLEAELRDGRLVQVSCGWPDAGAYAGVRRWNVLAVAPSTAAARPGAVLALGPTRVAVPRTVQAMAAVAERASPAQLMTYRYPGSQSDSHMLRCDADPADGHTPALAEVGETLHGWQLDFSRAERARHRQVSDAELAEGRVGLASCGLKMFDGETYHQPLWLFSAPPGTHLAVGDVVELLLGEAESGGGSGRISQYRRTVGALDPADPARTPRPCR